MHNIMVFQNALTGKYYQSEQHMLLIIGAVDKIRSKLQYRAGRCRMRLIWVFMFLIVVSIVFIGCQAKSKTTSSSKSKSSSTSKHSAADHGKKTHHETGHKVDKHDHSKTSESHKSKNEDKPKAKKNERKHNNKQKDRVKATTVRTVQKAKVDDRIKYTTKKPQGRQTVTSTTPSLPVVIHRKRPGGNNVTNNGTSGVGFIIDAPFIPCPEGQRRMKGECKTVF